MPFCSDCGATVASGARFCRECGSHQPLGDTETPHRPPHKEAVAEREKADVPPWEHIYTVLAVGCAALIVIGAFLPWTVIRPSFRFEDTVSPVYVGGFPYALGSLAGGLAMATLGLVALSGRQPLKGLFYVPAAVFVVIILMVGSSDSVQREHEREVLDGSTCEFGICGSSTASGWGLSLAGALIGVGVLGVRGFHRHSKHPLAPRSADGSFFSIEPPEFLTRRRKRCPACKKWNASDAQVCSRCASPLAATSSREKSRPPMKDLRRPARKRTPRFDPSFDDELARLGERADNADGSAADRIRELAALHELNVDRFESWTAVTHAITERRRRQR